MKTFLTKLLMTIIVFLVIFSLVEGIFWLKALPYVTTPFYQIMGHTLATVLATFVAAAYALELK